VTVFAHLLTRMNEGGLLCAHDTEFHEGYLELLDAIRPHSLHLPALNGFTIWRI
jgi:hypothetical protein